MFFLGKLFARDCCISMIGWTHCVAFPLLLVLYHILSSFLSVWLTNIT